MREVEIYAEDAGDPGGMGDVPFVAFGNDELAAQPAAHEGDEISCPHCGGTHLLEGSVNAETGGPGSMLFYECGHGTYLAAVGGKLVTGLLSRS